MRKLFGLAAVAALLVSGAAQAAPTQFSGSISVVISSLPGIGVSASGTALTNSGGGTFSLAGGTFATVASVPVTDPAAFPIGGVKASVSNGAGAFVGGAGTMPVIGTANVCLFGACNASVANVDVPFTVGPGTSGVGIGGSPIIVGGLVNVTVTGAPWTAGTVSIGTATAMGYVAGNTVQLVTPVVINTNIGASPTLPAFGILNLTFIPEPGTLALLASGVVGLGILGRKRMSK